MRILQISNNDFNSETEIGQWYSPLHFGYHELKDMGYDVELLYPNEVRGRFLYKIFGNHINDILLQLRCIGKSKDYDMIYYPIDRHCILLALIRKFKLIKCPIVMLCHFSLNTKYVDSKIKKVYKFIERFLVFRYFDKIVFPCENLMKFAVEKAPKGTEFGVAHWGADYRWYSEFRNQSSKCEYYMGCGGTNRDYKTLIEAVNDTSIKVRIYTSRSHIDRLMELNPSENIIFIEAKGNHRKEILREGYSNAKAVLIPINKINDVPNGATVLVESLASGKPILISDLVTNFIDVKQEKVGITTKLHDSGSWKEALLKLENTPELLDLYSQNALDLSKSKYNMSQFAAEISVYFNSVVNKYNSV